VQFWKISVSIVVHAFVHRVVLIEGHGRVYCTVHSAQCTVLDQLIHCGSNMLNSIQQRIYLEASSVPLKPSRPLTISPTYLDCHESCNLLPLLRIYFNSRIRYTLQHWQLLVKCPKFLINISRSNSTGIQRSGRGEDDSDVQIYSLPKFIKDENQAADILRVSNSSKGH
jgi:hypothetical protein